MLPVRILIQNMNGLSTVKTSIHSTWQRISQYDIAETQVVHSVQHDIRSHHLFSIPDSAPNRRGEGLIIAVSKQLPYLASQWRKDTVNHVIWVTLESPSAQLPPITIGVCYIPPITSHQMALSSVTDRFDTLTRHIRAAVAAAAAAATPAHIMVAGDFNLQWRHPTTPVTGPGHQCSWPTPDATLRRHLHGLVHRQDPPWIPQPPPATSPPNQTATHMPPPHQPQPPPANTLNTPITAEEISLGLQQLHNGRAGALQGYSSEFLRYAKLLPTPESPAPPNLIIPCIQAMFNEAYSSGKVPIQWQTALITPIFKHGDASDPANYRPIALGEPLCRLYENILNHRLTQYTEHQQLRTHNKLDIDLTSVLFIKHLFCNMSLTSKNMHMNHCTFVL